MLHLSRKILLANSPLGNAVARSHVHLLSTLAAPKHPSITPILRSRKDPNLETNAIIEKLEAKIRPPEQEGSRKSRNLRRGLLLFMVYNNQYSSLNICYLCRFHCRGIVTCIVIWCR